MDNVDAGAAMDTSPTDEGIKIKDAGAAMDTSPTDEGIKIKDAGADLIFNREKCAFVAGRRGKPRFAFSPKRTKLHFLNIALAGWLLTLLMTIPFVRPASDISFTDIGYVAVQSNTAVLKAILPVGDRARSGHRFLNFIRNRKFISGTKHIIQRMENVLEGFDDLQYFLGFSPSNFRTAEATNSTTAIPPVQLRNTTLSILRTLSAESEVTTPTIDNEVNSRQK